MNVKKRNGKIVPFNKEYIQRAVGLAAAATGEADEEKVKIITDDVTSAIMASGKEQVDIETIQNAVEESLFKKGCYQTAKSYILYRSRKERERANGSWKEGLLSKEFLSPYKHAPNPMEQLGSFVFTRTYSRFLPEYGRREFWWETVRRAVEYNCSLAPTTKEEAEKLYDNVYHMRQFMAGRTLWIGGTKVAEEYPLANYNCAFEAIDSYHAYHDLFYLLMVGSGVGVRVLKEDAEKLPYIRTDIEILHKAYEAKPKAERLEFTDVTFTKTAATIAIGDSKEGWAQALERYFDIMTNREYKQVHQIVLVYDSIRPKGERLKTFGGTASGHNSMMTMLDKIHKVIKAAGTRDQAARVKLRPIDLLDIANIIGENVVSGGVRRTSEIGLVDADDKECIEAKSQLYRQVNGKWEIDKALSHRQMSNNSILYHKKPTREQLHWHIQQVRYSGEPGWINEEAAKKRRPDFKGCNPCGEILLDSHGLCNLTTVNVMAFVKDGKIDEDALMEAQRLSANAGYRVTCRELELHDWNYVQMRDRLLGCSLTGWQDMVNATHMDWEGQRMLLRKLRKTAKEAANEQADRYGMPHPKLVTTVKPEGTQSLMPTVSAGVHYSHAPYYIRRIRISASDPLCKLCEDLGYPVFPEVGQDPKDPMTKVIEFPVKAPEGTTKDDVSAINQLENYKMFMENYVDHNCSITVHVRENEWDEVEQWVWDNWDSIVAITFLSYDGGFYKLMPYEEITEEEYKKRKEKMKPFNQSLLSQYEAAESELDIGESECANGACPIR